MKFDVHELPSVVVFTPGWIGADGAGAHAEAGDGTTKRSAPARTLRQSLSVRMRSPIPAGRSANADRSMNSDRVRRRTGLAAGYGIFCGVNGTVPFTSPTPLKAA